MLVMFKYMIKVTNVAKKYRIIGNHGNLCNVPYPHNFTENIYRKYTGCTTIPKLPTLPKSYLRYGSVGNIGNVKKKMKR